MIQTPLSIPEHVISRFFVIGVNFQKANAELRGSFSLSPDNYDNLLHDAHVAGIHSAFAVSTCNRTEIYGFVHHAGELFDLIVKHTGADAEQFRSVSYCLQGDDAIQHLFKVAAGLNSQIIGDYEILGQIKTAVVRAQQHKVIGPIMDRLINFVLQCSKKIKTTTALSTGTVSVSFAAIEWMRSLPNYADRKILVYGTGKFGRNLIKNIRTYLPSNEVSIINRTDLVAEEIAVTHQLTFIPHQQLATAVDAADIVIVCTNAGEYTIHPKFFTTQKQRVLMDLSVPTNVDPAAGAIYGNTLLNVDEISIILAKTLRKREAEIPKALTVINESKAEFRGWLSQYRHASMISDAKQKLETLSLCPFLEASAINNWQDLQIKKTVNKLAVNLKTRQEKGCQFISAYHEFLNHQSA
jgi:glutamyl-tRNA reductase